MRLRIRRGGGGGKEQIRRANKFERKGGPHALNLNLWLVGQKQEVRVKSSEWRETERLIPISHCSEADGEIGHRDDVTAILPSKFQHLKQFHHKHGASCTTNTKIRPRDHINHTVNIKDTITSYLEIETGRR